MNPKEYPYYTPDYINENDKEVVLLPLKAGESVTPAIGWRQSHRNSGSVIFERFWRAGHMRKSVFYIHPAGTVSPLSAYAHRLDDEDPEEDLEETTSEELAHTTAFAALVSHVADAMAGLEASKVSLYYRSPGGAKLESELEF